MLSIPPGRSSDTTTHDAAAHAGLKRQSFTPAQAYDAMRDAGLEESLASMGAEYATVYSTGWGDYTTPTSPSSWAASHAASPSSPARFL